jgi:hypothetical protein
MEAASHCGEGPTAMIECSVQEYNFQERKLITVNESTGEYNNAP